MRVHLHYEQAHKHQLQAMCDMADGLCRHGLHCDVSPDLVGVKRAEFIVWWGDKVPESLRHIPRLILEAGYINGRSGDYHRDRLQFISAGWNGLHGRADPGASDCPPNRWQALELVMRPWSTVGTHLLICEQHPGDAAAPAGGRWAEQCAAAMKRHDCIYRPHPLIATEMRPLAFALDSAHKVMTWSSTAAIEAVLAGVPTIALDPGSIAWDVCSHSITDNLYLGPREQWAYNLAYRQWSHDELRDGTAWEVLKHGLATDN